MQPSREFARLGANHRLWRQSRPLLASHGDVSHKGRKDTANFVREIAGAYLAARGVVTEGVDTTQRDAFAAGEGDAYEIRNAGATANTDVVRQIAAFVGSKSSVLEVGCGAGQNLRALESIVPGITCFGIDPSPVAIQRAQAVAPHHVLEVATSDDIPFDGPIDLVFFGFCLYLCDRALLHKTVAEADRVLSFGQREQPRFLAILDFDSVRPTSRPYHHNPRLTTYKMDYSALFLADPAYQLISKTPLNHATGASEWAANTEERVALWILEKNSRWAYCKQAVESPPGCAESQART